MAKGGQTESGKAWEYGLARAAATVFSVPLSVNNPRNSAQKAYSHLDKRERERIDNAASEAVAFLRIHDNSLNDTVGVSIQSDMQGKIGDVRDVIIHTGNGDEVGISAKHRHKAVKHSRLSSQIDFGDQWYGRKCSDKYWHSTNPVWNRLTVARDAGGLWQDLPDKAQTIYAPIVRAFMAEVRSAPAEKLLRYILGIYDYYKVVKDNGNVILQSFNLGGTLDWGKKLHMPSRIIDVEQRRDNIAVISFDKGWSLSFRVHNAESKAAPSVKFDINLVGTPLLANHIIAYD